MTLSYKSANLKTGRKYGFIDEQPVDSAAIGTILAVHGFPDTAYLWRNQIPIWVSAGYRVIAPDMLGYGETDKPEDVSLYAQKSISGDIASLLDHLGIEKVILIGHDWGAFCSYRFVGWHPARVVAMVSISVPYIPPNPQAYFPLDTVVKFLPNWGYQLYFNAPESAKEIEGNLEGFFRLLFQKVTNVDALENPMLQIGEFQDRITGNVSMKDAAQAVSDEVFQHHLKIFSQHGIEKCLFWYRNGKQNYEDEKDNAIPILFPAEIPFLFITGEFDLTAPPNFVTDMPKFVPDLKMITIPGVFHWVTEEAGEEVNKHIMSFLEDRVKPKLSA